MGDTFQSYSESIDGPVSNAEAVTPDNGTDLNNVTRALYVGVSGDVQVTMKGGQTVTFLALAVGWHPIRVSRVWVTNTTATDMVGVY